MRWLLHTYVGNTRTLNISRIPESQKIGCVPRPHAHVVKLGPSILLDNVDGLDNMHLDIFQELDLRNCLQHDLTPHNCFVHVVLDPLRRNSFYPHGQSKPLDQQFGATK